MNTLPEARSGSLGTGLRGALIIAIVIAAPFYSGSSSALGQAVNETALLALGIVSFGTFYWSNRGRIDYSDAEIIGLVLLFAAMVSAVFAVFTIDAWNTVGTMILLGIGFRAATSEAREREGFIRFFALGLVISGVVQTLISLHQYFFPGWYEKVLPEFYRLNIYANMRGKTVRAVGGFINANYLAAFLNIGIAVAVALLLFAAMKLWQRILIGAAAVFLLVGVLLSGSKGAMLVSAFIVAVLAVIKDKRLLWLVLVVLLLLVAIPNPVRDSVIWGISVDRYIQMRPAIWGSALQMFLDHPVVGVGPANFNFVSFVYAPPTDFRLVRFSRTPGIAHNSILHAFAEFGLLGGIPLLILFGAIVWLAVRTLVMRTKLSDREIGLGLALAILGVFLHSMVDNVANNRAVLTVLVFAVPVLSAITPISIFEPRRALRIPSSRNAIVAVAVMLVVAGFYTAQVIKPLSYEMKIHDMQRGLNEQIAVIDAKESQSTINNAKASIRGYLDRLEELRIHFPENPAVNRAIGNGYRVLFRSEGKFDDFLDADMAYMRAAESVHGRSRQDHYVRLLLRFDLTMWGYPKSEDILASMEQLASETIKQWPNHAVYYHTAATVARENGDMQLAKLRLEKAIELEPNFLQAIADMIRLGTSINDPELRRNGERKLAEALQRISDGPPIEAGDDYGHIITAPPR